MRLARESISILQMRSANYRACMLEQVARMPHSITAPERLSSLRHQDDLGIAAPKNGLLNPGQILRQCLTQYRAAFALTLDAERESGGNHSPTPQIKYHLTISRSCIGQKTFLSPCAADFRRDSIVSPPSRVHPAVRCIESFVFACAAPLVHPKDFHHFVTEVVDDFDGDAS